MKRFVLLILLLAMALSMTGCLTVTGGNDQPDELPPEEQHLTADVDETEVWHRRHDDVWSGQDEPELVSRDFERISGAAANGMTVGQELLRSVEKPCLFIILPMYSSLDQVSPPL